jgi:hypothetical protein
MGGNITKQGVSGEELTIRMHYKTFENREFKKGRVVATVTKNEQTYFCLVTELVGIKELDLSGEGCIDFIIAKFPLGQNSYMLSTYIEGNKEIQDLVIDATEPSAIDGDYYGAGKNYLHGWGGGIGVLIHFHWNCKQVTAN